MSQSTTSDAIDDISDISEISISSKDDSDVSLVNSQEKFDVIIQFFVDPDLDELILQMGNGRPTKISKKGKAPNNDRGIQEGATNVYRDYFSHNRVFNEDEFRRRYRMCTRLLMRICDDISLIRFFQQRRDATGKLGGTVYQKVTAALRILAYGDCGDRIVEYVRYSESQIIKCLHKFLDAIISTYGEKYLRCPTVDDAMRISAENERRGFPGLIGSLDCMHWSWKNCPKAWSGQYKNARAAASTIILEAIATKDLWIWHCFCGTPGMLYPLYHVIM